VTKASSLAALLSRAEPAGVAFTDPADPATGAEFDTAQFVTFELADERYAVPMEQVREIIRIPDLVRVPLGPGCLIGVANLRGRVLPVVDLRSCCGLPTVPHDETTRVIVVDAIATVGLVVDRVTSVVTVERSMVEPAAAVQATVRSDVSTAVVKTPMGLATVLDVDRILHARFRMLTGSAARAEARPVVPVVAGDDGAEVGAGMALTRRGSPAPAESTGEPAGLADLCADLDDGDPDVCRRAVLALTGRPEAIDALLTPVGVEPDPAARQATLTALAQVDTPETALSLIPFLRGEDAALRGAVLATIGAMPTAVAQVAPLLIDDDDPDVRILTARLLVELDRPQVGGWLESMLAADDHPNVVAAALDAFLPLAEGRHVPLLRSVLDRFPGDPFIRFTIGAHLPSLEGGVSMPATRSGSLVITSSDFERFREYFYRRTGIHVTEERRCFVDKRLRTCIERAGERSFASWFAALRMHGNPDLLQDLVDQLTVNETSYQRPDTGGV